MAAKAGPAEPKVRIVTPACNRVPGIHTIQVSTKLRSKYFQSGSSDETAAGRATSRSGGRTAAQDSNRNSADELSSDTTAMLQEVGANTHARDDMSRLPPRASQDAKPARSPSIAPRIE
jgi:hypothetical protein